MRWDALDVKTQVLLKPIYQNFTYKVYRKLHLCVLCVLLKSKRL